MNESDPLYPHLMDILADPASQHLILAGGFGIRLKRHYLSEHLIPAGERTIIAEIPDVRPTLDLDFFLKFEIFIETQHATRVRDMLDRLNYQVTAENWQFSRALRKEVPDRLVHVDLMARLPGSKEESDRVRVQDPRVKSRNRGFPLHGRMTPEAFAVEDSPVLIPLKVTTGNATAERIVHVPHPYAWIQMKTAAAWDWLHPGGSDSKPPSGKHAFDVYILVAMVTENEFAECSVLRRRYETHPEVKRLRGYGEELFGSATAPGFLEARRQAGQNLDFETFWEAYQQIMG